MIRGKLVNIEKVMQDIEKFATPQERRRINLIAARSLLTAERRRVKEQKNLDGTPFAPRKKKDGKNKKMLTKMLKGGKNPQVSVQGIHRAHVASTNLLASYHHHGVRRPIEKKPENTIRQDLKEPCTKEQAKQLQQMGISWSISKIQKQFSRAAAHFRIHRNKEFHQKTKSLFIELPKRHVLGLNKENTQIAFEAMQTQLDLLIEKKNKER